MEIWELYVDVNINEANMKHLYIIGNGFDIHHDIQCGFDKYAKWLEKNYPDIYYQVEDWYFAYDKKLWSDFEHLLGDLDVRYHARRIADENFPSQKKLAESEGREFDNLKRKYEQSSEEARDEFEALYESIRNSFREWVEQLDKPKADRKLPIEKVDSLFITFNYTDVLESLYRVPEERILYIHGKAKRDDELILGHGLSQDDIQTRNTEVPPEDLKTEEEIKKFFDRQGDDSVVDETYDVIVNQLAEQVKPVGRLMRKIKMFMSGNEDVDVIHIYGFSFSDIDMPYIEDIASMVDLKSVKWEVSYYDDEDEERFRKMVRDIGVSDEKISTATLEKINKYGGCETLFV